MSNFFVGLWESIFTPGTSPALLVATNVAFAALQVVLLVLLFFQFSVHWLVLSLLCGGLWYSINWFVAELAVYQAKEEEEKRKREAQGGGAATGMASSSSDSETEVEGAAPVPTPSRKEAAGGVPTTTVVAPKAPAEPVEPAGEMRKRGGGGGGGSLAPAEDAMTQSSVSTEDEWEKVSESEDKK